MSHRPFFQKRSRQTELDSALRLTRQQSAGAICEKILSARSRLTFPRRQKPRCFSLSRFGSLAPLFFVFAHDACDLCYSAVSFTFLIDSHLKDERHLGPEIDVLVSTLALKFNFSQRYRSRSTGENSIFNYLPLHASEATRERSE